MNSEQGIVSSEPREWIIQRCTQKWIGTSLVYEDFPTPEGLMTRTEMIKVLERVDRAHPVDEYRGHNVVAERARLAKAGANG